MTTNGTDSLYITEYKVGSSVFRNYDDALIHYLRERQSTSCVTGIEVIRGHEYNT